MSSVTHMLDTNICSYLMRESPASVLERVEVLGPDRLAVSVITALELYEGAELSSKPSEYRKRVDAVLEYIRPLPLPVEAAPVGAKIRAKLRKAGKPVGDMDSLIAAHAMHAGLTLVSNNLREFARIDGLKTENWV
jgi:tRNA(fMet)-specific endonuclease VapC